MDKIEKALQKLTRRERAQVKRTLQKISASDLRELDVKKLKGRKDIFRVRAGRIRIMYQTRKGRVFILAIERRSETTYR